MKTQSNIKALNLTEKEELFLRALLDGLFEIDFSDMTVQDIADKTGITTSVLRGVQSSLVKKGIISVHANEANYQIIYLNPSHYYLHPEGWGEPETQINIEALSDATTETAQEITYKGYELLSMLTRKQQRLYFQNASRIIVGDLMFQDFKNMTTFLAHSFVWENTKQGTDYWSKVAGHGHPFNAIEAGTVTKKTVIHTDDIGKVEVEQNGGTINIWHTDDVSTELVTSFDASKVDFNIAIKRAKQYISTLDI